MVVFLLWVHMVFPPCTWVCGISPLCIYQSCRIRAHPTGLIKGPMSKRSCILKYWGWGLKIHYINWWQVGWHISTLISITTSRHCAKPRVTPMKGTNSVPICKQLIIPQWSHLPSHLGYSYRGVQLGSGPLLGPTGLKGLGCLHWLLSQPTWKNSLFPHPWGWGEWVSLEWTLVNTGRSPHPPQTKIFYRCWGVHWWSSDLANARNMGSIPGLGRFHMLWGN